MRKSGLYNREIQAPAAPIFKMAEHGIHVPYENISIAQAYDHKISLFVSLVFK